MQSDMPRRGNIHSVESLAALDGKGIRYEVFFMGCPFRCAYCHNPDTWAGEGTMHPTAEELVAKIVRYKPYFGKDGGVTLSGGEVLVQSEFALELTRLLHEKGVNVALDTSGGVPLTDSVKSLLAEADMTILDLKFYDDDGYRRYCRGGIENVLATLDFLQSRGACVWLRTVVVPGINDSEKEIEKYADIVRRYDCVSRWQLLAFHTMGFAKYDKLGIANPLAGTPALPKDRLAQLQDYADSLIGDRYGKETKSL